MVMNFAAKLCFDPPHELIASLCICLSLHCCCFHPRTYKKSLFNQPNAQKQNKDTHYKETIIHRLEQTRKQAGWPGPRSPLAAARSSDTGESSLARAPTGEAQK